MQDTECSEDDVFDTILQLKKVKLMLMEFYQII